MPIQTCLVELPITPEMGEKLKRRLCRAVRERHGHIEILVNPKGVTLKDHQEERCDW